jgi:hypothetical protein
MAVEKSEQKSELARFQEEMERLIESERKSGTHGHFNEEIRYSELTENDKEMYEFVEELKAAEYTIESGELLEDYDEHIKSYLRTVRNLRNASREIFAKWLTNVANPIIGRTKQALERMPAFRTEIAVSCKKRRNLASLRVDDLMRKDMETYNLVKNISRARLSTYEREIMQEAKQCKDLPPHEVIRLLMEGKPLPVAPQLSDEKICARISEKIAAERDRYEHYLADDIGPTDPSRQLFRESILTPLAHKSFTRLDRLLAERRMRVSA